MLFALLKLKSQKVKKYLRNAALVPCAELRAVRQAETEAILFLSLRLTFLPSFINSTAQPYVVG